MKVLTCAATERRLHALHDGELSMTDQVAVQAHLDWCDRCAEKLAELRLVRYALRRSRLGGLPVSNDEAIRFARDVVARAVVEEQLSLRTRLREAFTDMHFVYAALGALVAALFCGVVMLSMMRLATSESPGSLAALVRIIGSPGSNENPVAVSAWVSLPRALDDSLALPAAHLDDAAFTLRGVITREGRVQHVELLASSGHAAPPAAHEVQLLGELMGALSRSRFEPASRGGATVAVKMVWIVAHTTVRGGEGVGKAPARGALDRSAASPSQASRSTTPA